MLLWCLLTIDVIQWGRYPLDISVLIQHVTEKRNCILYDYLFLVNLKWSKMITTPKTIWKVLNACKMKIVKVDLQTFDPMFVAEICGQYDLYFWNIAHLKGLKSFIETMHFLSNLQYYNFLISLSYFSIY